MIETGAVRNERRGSNGPSLLSFRARLLALRADFNGPEIYPRVAWAECLTVRRSTGQGWCALPHAVSEAQPPRGLSPILITIRCPMKS
jgi:hypothetical protein